MKKQGILLIISGPSGSGKGTIVGQLCEKNDFALSISATTRKPREKEEHGVHYRDHRSNGTRLLEVKYIPSSAVGSDESAVSDETNSV